MTCLKVGTCFALVYWELLNVHSLFHEQKAEIKTWCIYVSFDHWSAPYSQLRNNRCQGKVVQISMFLWLVRWEIVQYNYTKYVNCPIPNYIGLSCFHWTIVAVDCTKKKGLAYEHESTYVTLQNIPKLLNRSPMVQTIDQTPECYVFCWSS